MSDTWERSRTWVEEERSRPEPLPPRGPFPTIAPAFPSCSPQKALGFVPSPELCGDRLPARLPLPPSERLELIDCGLSWG